MKTIVILQLATTIIFVSTCKKKNSPVVNSEILESSSTVRLAGATEKSLVEQGYALKRVTVLTAAGPGYFDKSDGSISSSTNTSSGRSDAYMTNNSFAQTAKLLCPSGIVSKDDYNAVIQKSYKDPAGVSDVHSLVALQDGSDDIRIYGSTSENATLPYLYLAYAPLNMVPNKTTVCPNDFVGCRGGGCPISDKPCFLASASNQTELTLVCKPNNPSSPQNSADQSCEAYDGFFRPAASSGAIAFSSSKTCQYCVYDSWERFVKDAGEKAGVVFNTTVIRNPPTNAKENSPCGGAHSSPQSVAVANGSCEKFDGFFRLTNNSAAVAFASSNVCQFCVYDSWSKFNADTNGKGNETFNSIPVRNQPVGMNENSPCHK